MDRLTFEGNFCDIAMCQEFPCKYPDTGCSQKQIWNRLKEYEDTGYTPADVIVLSCTAGREIVDRDRYIQYLMGIPFDRLQEVEELIRKKDAGLIAELPMVAMVEQSLQGGEMKPEKDQRFNGRYAVVYSDKKKWGAPLIDICGGYYNPDEAEERKKALMELMKEGK